jgi:hypothetical protein
MKRRLYIFPYPKESGCATDRRQHRRVLADNIRSTALWINKWLLTYFFTWQRFAHSLGGENKSQLFWHDLAFRMSQEKFGLKSGAYDFLIRQVVPFLICGRNIDMRTWFLFDHIFQVLKFHCRNHVANHFQAWQRGLSPALLPGGKDSDDLLRPINIIGSLMLNYSLKTIYSIKENALDVDESHVFPNLCCRSQTVFNSLKLTVVHFFLCYFVEPEIART